MDIDERVRELIGRMSIEEKIAQLISIPLESVLDGKKFSVEKAREVLKYGVGEILRIGGSSARLSPREAVEIYNAIQRFLTRETRLGIPAIVHEESIAGLLAPTATVFPIPLALASTWDPDLVYRVAVAIRRQIMAIGSRHTLAPVLDLCREPRWGRCEETYGEDSYLAASMGIAYVKGIQGDDIRYGVIATGKHFVGHGVPEGGRNIASIHVGLRELLEIYMYPFEATVKEANLLSIMPAYHDIDNVPCHANKWLLTDILRGSWGFKGIAVSDYEGVKQLHTIHRVARDCMEAAVKAIKAGVDIEYPSGECFKQLVEAVRKGLIDEDTINRAVERVLKLKFMLGLFENPFIDETKVPTTLDNEADRELAREVARKAIVLLKNDGILPLKRDIKTIAVIGPNANDPWAMLGDYHYDAHIGSFDGTYGKISPSVRIVTVLEAIKSRVSPSTEVLYAKGCDTIGDDRSGFGEAIEIAKRADIIIAVMGDRSGLFNLKMFTSGEGVDRASLKLPGVQEELLKELASLGKPIILVLINGRPLALSSILPYVNAIVEAWRPGEEGGNAIADILFGDYSPGGRLPVSLPYDVGQLPIYYSRKPNCFRDYVEYPAKPLFPFGYGLSYTQFAYENLVVESTEVRDPDTVIRVSVDVKNVGSMAGDEVVQLYISRDYASVTRPVAELKGFKRITLEPGEKKTVVFEIPLELLAYYDMDMNYVVEPGEYTFMINKNAEETILKTKISVIGGTKIYRERRVFTSKAYVR